MTCRPNMDEKARCEIELVYFWRMMQYLNTARRTGDHAALVDACESLELIEMHGADNHLRNRARSAIEAAQVEMPNVPIAAKQAQMTVPGASMSEIFSHNFREFQTLQSETDEAVAADDRETARIALAEIEAIWLHTKSRQIREMCAGYMTRRADYADFYNFAV